MNSKFKSGREAFEAGCTLLANNQNNEALAAFTFAQTVEPRQPAIPANIGHILGIMGQTEDARRSYSKAIDLAGKSDPSYELRRSLLTPIIFQSVQQIKDERIKLKKELQRLSETKYRLQDPQTQIGNPSFFLAYQGENNKELQSQIASTLLKQCSNLAYRSSELNDTGFGKPRVGFFSSFFREHTVARVNLGLIKHFPRDDWEVVVIRPESNGDSVTKLIESAADVSVKIDTHVFKAREQIAALKLDVLLYCDIGMDDLSYYLAFSRLASVQAVLWGHPDTTGNKQVDYYISSLPFEPDHSEEHYSEELVTLPKQYVCMEKPEISNFSDAREFFGVNREDRIYYCPQNPFKLHPDTDNLFKDILNTDDKAKICLSSGSEISWNSLLAKRFKKTLPEFSNRIQFIERAAPHDFANVMRSADVVFDPLNFTGGYTSYLALSAGVPVLTIPGQFMRGRLTSGLYKMCGWNRFSFNDTLSLAKEAYRLASDKDAQLEARKETLERTEVLFNDIESVVMLSDKLLELLERSRN